MQKGFLGVGRRVIQVGDNVAPVAGGKMPVVMRRTSSIVLRNGILVVDFKDQVLIDIYSFRLACLPTLPMAFQKAKYGFSCLAQGFLVHYYSLPRSYRYAT